MQGEYDLRRHHRHQQLPEVGIAYITAGVRAVLAEVADINGYSSLAAGADQLFATEVLAVGGRLHAVIPAAGYSATLEGEPLQRYEELLHAACDITELPFDSPGEPAYDAAGRWIAERCEVLVAVWDGEPARGLGGTADAVARARALGRDVRIIWPEGLTRP
jgi:hypothetical protein